MKWGYGDPLAYDCPPRTESALIGELTGIVPALEKKKPAEEIPTVPVRDLIEEAFAHLGAAKIQFIDSDDQIIKEHVLAAYELIKAVYWRLR